MDDLRGSDLKAAYWFNTHRQEVYAAARIAGFIVVGIIWLVVIWHVFIYIRNYAKTERALSEAGLVQVLYDSIDAPKDIVVLGRDATPHSDSTIDAYAIVQNPNRFYVARFSYSFTIQGVTKTFDTGLLLPEETTYLVVNNVTGPSTASVEIKIEAVTWQRTYGPQIEVDFQVADLALTTGELASQTITSTTSATTQPTIVPDEEFIVPEDEPTVNDTAPVGETFTQLGSNITNASPYGFERVRVVALLRNEQKQIVGVQQVVWSNVGSFTTLPLEINWLQRFAYNTQPELIIQTDVWDRSNLILPGED